jgi:methylphosphotriester-DNA--protein-cysteine methyltransferase
VGAAIIAGVDTTPVLESAEPVLDLVPAAVERDVVRDWCLPASFASARYRQPGATGSLDMLSGHLPEIIRKHSRDRGAHVVCLAETSKRSRSDDLLDGSLEAVAAAIGYQSASAFSTAFRREVGSPPSHFARTTTG